MYHTFANVFRCKWMSHLKLSRTYFHFSFHHGSPVIFPMVPVYPIIRSLTCLQVLTVKVGVVTSVIPPTTVVCHSAVATLSIIVSVFGRELHSVVIFQRVPSITLNICLLALNLKNIFQTF